MPISKGDRVGHVDGIIGTALADQKDGAVEVQHDSGAVSTWLIRDAAIIRPAFPGTTPLTAVGRERPRRRRRTAKRATAKRATSKKSSKKRSAKKKPTRKRRAGKKPAGKKVARKKRAVKKVTRRPARRKKAGKTLLRKK